MSIDPTDFILKALTSDNILVTAAACALMAWSCAPSAPVYANYFFDKHGEDIKQFARDVYDGVRNYRDPQYIPSPITY